MHMVKSPKSGRELKGQRGYKGPRWLSKLVRKLGTNPEDEQPDQ